MRSTLFEPRLRINCGLLSWFPPGRDLELAGLSPVQDMNRCEIFRHQGLLVLLISGQLGEAKMSLLDAQ